MRKFSTSLLVFLNIGMLLIQWQCSRSSSSSSTPAPEVSPIPLEWDGKQDYLPAGWQLRELE
ncbi:MAG: hypothetical protein ACOH5I_18425 [Oligoflexus sp.]